MGRVQFYWHGTRVGLRRTYDPTIVVRWRGKYRMIALTLTLDAVSDNAA